MPSRMIRICVGALFAAINFSTAAFAIDTACFSGVWMMDKELSNANTSPLALIAPFGDNGWVRGTANEGPMAFARAETRLVAFNGRVYTVFGTDPREFYMTENGDYALDSTSEGTIENSTNTVHFTEDCMRMDASSNPEEIRIFDKVLPEGASAMAPSGLYYGLWMMNRQASSLTRPGTRDASSTDDEFVLIAPWGNGGWAYSVVSGGYQPADLKERGMTAPHLQRRISQFQEAYLATMQPAPPDYDWTLQKEMYYATWNGTPAYTMGSYPRQVELRKIDDQHFEMEFVRIHQPWLAALGGVQSSIVFSDDGKRMTVTSSGVSESAERFENDIRVYDKADPADWPSKESSFPPQ